MKNYVAKYRHLGKEHHRIVEAQCWQSARQTFWHWCHKIMGMTDVLLVGIHIADKIKICESRGPAGLNEFPAMTSSPCGELKTGARSQSETVRFWVGRIPKMMGQPV